MEKLLKLLEKDARLTVSQLAVMLQRSEEDVCADIARLENEGVIKAYKTMINWEKTDRHLITAIIELKVTPQRDRGFEAIAETIAQFEEVQDVYLMSGGYDLAVHVNGYTLQDIAAFVARRLSTLDSVVSTATHFILRRYKESGILLLSEKKDGRGEN